MDEAERPAPVFTQVPVYAGRSGQTLVPTEVVINFIRSVANVAEHHDDTKTLVRVLRVEADALECQAIEQTRRPG